jgi:hypothetical protein
MIGCYDYVSDDMPTPSDRGGREKPFKGAVCFTRQKMMNKTMIWICYKKQQKSFTKVNTVKVKELRRLIF